MTKAGSSSSQEHESVQRRLLARAYGETYEAFPTLEEARTFEDAVVVLEAAAAEQIYVVCPVAQLHCPVEVLRRLLVALDEIAWCGGDPDRVGLYYERHALGSRVYGGTGGGRVTAGIWIHTQFERIGLRPAICQVLAGAPWAPGEALDAQLRPEG